MTSKAEVYMVKKDQEKSTDIITIVTDTKDIKSLIYVVRGQQESFFRV